MNTFEEAYYNAESFWSNGAITDAGNLARISFTSSMIPSDVRTLLDAGCGNGVFGHYVQEHRPGVTVTGMDRSSTALQYVQTAKVQGDVTEIPFGPQAFDCVTCLQVVEHLPVGAFEQALHEIARVARRYAIISVPYRERTEENVTRCPQCQTIFNVDLHLRRFDDAVMQALFEPYGFRHVRNEFPRRHLRYLGLDELQALKQRLVGPKQAVQFLSPICPVCGYSEGDQTALSVSSKTDAPSHRRPSLLKSSLRKVAKLARPLWPQAEHPGYWVVSLYERV